MVTAIQEAEDQNGLTKKHVIVFINLPGRFISFRLSAKDCKEWSEALLQSSLSAQGIVLPGSPQ